jgi:hypothetical protein
MYARVSNYQFDPSQTDAIVASMDDLKQKIQSISGISTCITSWKEDGSGVTIAVYESKEAADAAAEQIMGIWSAIGQYLTATPVTEVYETVEDMLS